MYIGEKRLRKITEQQAKILELKDALRKALRKVIEYKSKYNGYKLKVGKLEQSAEKLQKNITKLEKTKRENTALKGELTTKTRENTSNEHRVKVLRTMLSKMSKELETLDTIKEAEKEAREAITELEALCADRLVLLESTTPFLLSNSINTKLGNKLMRLIRKGENAVQKRETTEVPLQKQAGGGQETGQTPEESKDQG